MGFRSDQVTSFLMGAAPHSEALSVLSESQQALYGYQSQDVGPREPLPGNHSAFR